MVAVCQPITIWSDLIWLFSALTLLAGQQGVHCPGCKNLEVCTAWTQQKVEELQHCQQPSRVRQAQAKNGTFLDRVQAKCIF